MINKHEGNLLDLQEGIIVHGCNCLGVMGSGIAKQIKDRWFPVFNAYRNAYLGHSLHLGQIIPVLNMRAEWDMNSIARIHSGPGQCSTLPPKLIIVNAMTQYHTVTTDDPDEVVVDYDAISAAFSQIKLLARETKLPVHFPLIGCGLANGKWEEVAPRIEAALGDDVEKHLWIYNPK